MTLAERVLAGDRLALARLLTKLEDSDPEGLDSLGALHAHTGRAHLVGITGGSGTGKSTLVNRLVLELRRQTTESPTVGVVAVDPSSPFTGGAILGDRIRMQDLAGDPGVFIRSMASRGALGGLARTTHTLVQALDAAGYDMVIIETVGAGQDEVELARTAHTTVVVEAPGLGDDIQAIKAGILEIADVLVLNKADLPGADQALRTLKASLEMAQPARRQWMDPREREVQGGDTSEHEVWIPPLIKSVALRGQGIREVVDAIEQHRLFLGESGEMKVRERSRLRAELEALLRERLYEDFLERQADGRFEATLDRVVAREIAPQRAVRELLEGNG